MFTPNDPESACVRLAQPDLGQECWIVNMLTHVTRILTLTTELLILSRNLLSGWRLLREVIVMNYSIGEESNLREDKVVALCFRGFRD